MLILREKTAFGLCWRKGERVRRKGGEREKWEGDKLRSEFGKVFPGMLILSWSREFQSKKNEKLRIGIGNEELYKNIPEQISFLDSFLCESPHKAP